jgi:hypothetical protein
VIDDHSLCEFPYLPVARVRERELTRGKLGRARLTRILKKLLIDR